jgi:hypothetical protein
MFHAKAQRRKVKPKKKLCVFAPLRENSSLQSVVTEWV